MVGQTQLKAQKVLIVRLGSLGDVVHAIPAQQCLHSYFPHAEIHWISKAPYLTLLSHIPGISRVWRADFDTWSWSSSQECWKTVRALRREKFDYAIDFQGLFKSALLARWAGARHVVGFAAGQTREPFVSLLYSRTPRVKEERLHVVDLNLRLVSLLGCSGDGKGLLPLRIPAESEQSVQRCLNEAGIERPVLINPGAGWVTKLWPTANYGQLADRIQRELNLPVVLTYGPGEETLVEEVQAASSTQLCRFPTSVLELAALCRKARLMVAGDTGPLHLAVALGTPSVSIMGPSTAWRNGPHQAADLVVQRRLPCSDCYKRTCNHFICMDISVEEVFSSVVRRLGL